MSRRTGILSKIAIVAALFIFTPYISAEPNSKLTHQEKMRSCPVQRPASIPASIRLAPLLESEVTASAAIQVPVYVHILQDSSGANPVTESIITKAISRLNSGFSKAGFAFNLQSIDSITNDSWAYPSISDLDSISSQLNVPDRQGVNIYITYLEDLCGISDLPYSESSSEAMFLDYRCVPGGSESDSYDTIIHEMGHFMGLFHTFAPEPNGCKGKGDYISDTPYQKVEHYQCKRYDTCPTKRGLDPTNNFMDYTSDDCKHRFTPQQIKLMRAAHRYYRLNSTKAFLRPQRQAAPSTEAH